LRARPSIVRESFGVRLSLRRLNLGLRGEKGFQMDRGRGRNEAFDHWMNI